MSIISALFDNRVYSFEQAFGAKDITSLEMQRAIQTWFSLYFQGETTKTEDSCQRLPAMIVNKLCKTVFSEYSATIQKKGEKAAFMASLLDRLDTVRKTALQQALVGGECFIKPALTGKGIFFSVVPRDCFLPLARDANGRITSVGTAEQTAVGGKYYTLLEKRAVDPDGMLTIESKLFRSDTRGIVGTEIPLETLERYAALDPSISLPGIGNLGMSPLRTPLLNCVDGSLDGVAVYAPAVGLIKNINRNERQLDDEFENGASRIIASADLMREDGRGKRYLDGDLFIALDENPGDIGINIFSPALREASYLARKQEYLRNIESLIGLKRGILSEVEAAERTATEITSSADDYNLTIQEFQGMWADMLRELLETCDRLGRLYQLCDGEAFDSQADLAIDWGDGVLFDREKTWQEYQSMVASGMLKPELALSWYFNLPHDTLRDLQRIRDTYMPDMEALADGEE